MVLEGSSALLEAGRQCGYLTEVLTAPPSQSMPSHECRLAALCDMAKQLPLTDESVEAPVQTLNRDGLDPSLDLFSYITENPSDCAYEVTLMKEKYFLPPRSRFLLSDITRMRPLVNSEFKQRVFCFSCKAAKRLKVFKASVILVLFMCYLCTII